MRFSEIRYSLFYIDVLSKIEDFEPTVYRQINMVKGWYGLNDLNVVRNLEVIDGKVTNLLYIDMLRSNLSA